VKKGMKGGEERERRINTIKYIYIERKIVYLIVEARKLVPRVPFIVFFFY
jgi:hypothetical protein